MPRRSLHRRIRPQAPDEQAIGTYLLRLPGQQLYRAPDTLPKLDSPHLFGGTRPLEVEIGCGSGEFLCFLAARDPAANFVGIELRLKSLYQAIDHAASRSLDNIRFVQADFTRMYPLLVPGSLRAVYLHFPDPNARTKFRKRRIFSARFLDQIH